MQVEEKNEKTEEGKKNKKRSEVEVENKKEWREGK